MAAAVDAGTVDVRAPDGPCPDGTGSTRQDLHADVMPLVHQRLRYRAAEAVATSPSVLVALPDGRLHARLRRRATGDGRTRWRWTGGGLHDFAVEVEPSGDSFLITDLLGIPFGRIGARGRLQPRLTALDAHAQRFVIDLDGRIRAGQGLPRGLGRISVPTPAEVTVVLAPTEEETLASLLAAAPLCHAAWSPSHPAGRSPRERLADVLQASTL